jgi:hypothetical protein
MASKGPEDSLLAVGTDITSLPFSSTAMENLVFEVHATKFAKRTLATK